MALSWSMDKIGPICRSAEDLAIVFNAIHGQDGIDQTLHDVPFNYNPSIDYSNLKVGYLKSDFDKQDPRYTLQACWRFPAEWLPYGHRHRR